MVQLYYFAHFGFYPPEAEAEKNKDGSFTLHLVEIVEDHTATSAWYTVDGWGVGLNAITEEAVDFPRCGPAGLELIQIILV